MILSPLATSLLAAQLALPPENLLVNPQFDHIHSAPNPAYYVAGWNVDQRGDLVAISNEQEGYTAIQIAPGKRVWQWISLADIDGEWKGTPLSFAVEITQQQPEAAQVRLSLMGFESAGGTWIPAELGPFGDTREFFRHGRGELITLDQRIARSPKQIGSHGVKAEGLIVDWSFTRQKQSDPDFDNVAGVLVEIENVSPDQSVEIRNPVLVRGHQAASGAIPGRDVPQWSRQIPRTMAKLLAGEPVYILTLGSSIDRGSANPRLYLYDQDPDSPTYLQPLASDKPFQPDLVQRPDLSGYIAWFQHYFMYTGRMRLELMRKYGHPVDAILLNVMACDGSSIGESHSGFADYASLAIPPSPNHNGHSAGKSWQELYPLHFTDGKIPTPDLVIFGHGHNERIDKPDEIAVFEGAIRWFQRHYPDVEFVNCMWIRREDDDLNHSMPDLCEHYGIPFIPVNKLIAHLSQSANYYAIAPDGGHPQAAAHYLWYKQLEMAFEATSTDFAALPQKHLPPRTNAWSYLWEGDLIHFEQDHPRHYDQRMMIVEDGPFNLWAQHDDKSAQMTIRINGITRKDAGRGRNSQQRDVRNSTFVYGRLAPGERHIVEINGDHPRILASDHKVAWDKQFFPAGHPAWQTQHSPQPFTSHWGHPYGDQLYTLHTGDILTLKVHAPMLSIAWLDQSEGGTFEVLVDDQLGWQQATNQPFIDSQGQEHFIENRRALTGLQDQLHTVQIRAIKGPVAILSAYGYGHQLE